MPRNITVTFADGSTHVYQNAPDNVTPDQVSQRAQKDFGKPVKALDGGRNQAQQKPVAPRVVQPAPSKDKGWDFFSGDYRPNALWQGVKSGVGDIVQAVGDTAGIIGNPLNATINALTGSHLSTNLGGTARQASGLPNNPSSKASMINQFAAGAMIPIPGMAAAKKTPQMAANAASTAITKAAQQTAKKAPQVATQQVIQAGKKFGVPVLTTDIRPPSTFIGRSAQAIGERIPIAGTGSVRAAQQAKRVEAVQSLIAEHGSPDLMDAASAVSGDLIATRGKQLQMLTAAKESAIKGVQGNVPVDRTLTKIDEQISWLSGINKDAYAPVIAKLEQFKANLASGKTLEQIEGNRKLLGDLFADPSLAAIKSDGQKALNAIYAPLRAEMGTYIRNKGGAGAFAKWQNANQRLAAMAGELDAKAFKNVLGAADTTPEKVSSLIFSKNPSDLNRIYANLSPVGRSRVQGAIIAKAAEGARMGDAISPQKFASAMEKLDRQIGVFFDPAERARLDGFTRLLKATQRASEAAVAPPTGVQAMPYAMGAGFASVFGPLGGLAAAGGTGLIARAYESPPVRNLLVGLSKTKPGSKAEMNILNRLAVPIAAIIEREGPQIMNAANDRTAASAAASNETGADNQQQQQALPQ